MSNEDISMWVGGVLVCLACLILGSVTGVYMQTGAIIITTVVVGIVCFAAFKRLNQGAISYLIGLCFFGSLAFLISTWAAYFIRLAVVNWSAIETFVVTHILR
ncbi:MAG: hypothetical protein HY455_02270 [Parcubacteria group bacterium]|nr:hypothetical protein [Parcubacteria group bacterium]